MIAGILNVISVIVVNTWQTGIESDKHKYNMRVETDKSTRDTLSEIIQTVDQGESCRRMKMLSDLKFTDTPVIVGAIERFLSEQCQRPTSNPPATPSLLPRISRPWSSGWVGGGSNQGEQCRAGMSAMQAEYPGRTIVVTGSSEASRKNILGQVTYRYNCSFDIL